jgi:CelD/BcsL family acetyltransferase involved in cellulose biosynthesis
MSISARLIETVPAASAVQRIGAEFATALSPASGLQMAIAATLDELAALGPEWSGLFERAGRPNQAFQTHALAMQWARHFLPDRGLRLAVVTVRRHGRLVLVWPLVSRRRVGLMQLGALGEPVGQYSDLIVEADDAADAMALMSAAWQHIRRELRPDLLWLRKVRADADVAGLLTKLAAIETDRQEAPYLDLASAKGFAAYEQRYTAKARKNRRRLWRRLGERGAIEITRHQGGADAAAEARTAIGLKRAWLADRGLVSTALADQRSVATLAEAAADVTLRGGTTVSTLSCDGRPLSGQIAFECKGQVLLHLIAYDVQAEKTGAGMLHLEDTIRDAADRGLQRLDLLAPNADYKMDWADGMVAVSDLAVPMSVAGNLYARLWLKSGRRRAKALIEWGARRLKRSRQPVAS